MATRLLLCGLLAAGVLSAPATPDVMNKGGVPYQISNPPGSTPNWVGTPGEYSTNFNTNIKGGAEHFDVYGEVQTQYSQVYWTRNTPINLPPALVERFKGKVMAITGYEVDQVTHTGPQPGSTTTPDALGGFSCYPDCSDTDASVPIYNAYNHHYFGWLTGQDAEVYDRETPVHLPNPTSTGVRTKLNATQTKYPTNIVFKENPGGEFRKSYHGYPSGYAQLLHSPTQWVVEPMQIDTHNRNYTINDTPGYVPDLLPKTDQNEMTDRSGKLSPLIECPCTDRIHKFTTTTSSVLTTGKCSLGISTLADCTAAASKLTKISSSTTVTNGSLPSGCLLISDAARTFSAVFNTAQSNSSCGSGSAPTAMFGSSSLGGLTTLDINHDGTTAHMTMSGPDGAWFGVGFNAEAMSDSPYTIVVDGKGAVTEHKIGVHAPGVVLASSITVVSSTASNGTRTVVMTRAVAGATKDHYTIPSVPGDINVITAVGSGVDLAYHKARTGATFTLLPTSSDACVCAPVVQQFMSYMNSSTTHWSNYDCLDEPRSDMLRHGDGTGRSLSNMACAMQSYHGGLKCCQHKFFLTDRAQATAIKNVTDTYFLKWRYYFQEYTPPTAVAPASHSHIHHWVFLIDANVNDYEEDGVSYGHSSIGKISAHLTMRDIGLEDTPESFNTITPLVMTPHCHAPSCIREEFWNADTNQIICNVSALYGDAKNGGLNQVFNEANYVAIPPCIFGAQPGLQKPFTLSPETNITAVKYFNNTYRHLGQMAQWTGLMVYDTDPF